MVCGRTRSAPSSSSFLIFLLPSTVTLRTSGRSVTRKVSTTRRCGLGRDVGVHLVEEAHARRSLGCPCRALSWSKAGPACVWRWTRIASSSTRMLPSIATRSTGAASTVDPRRRSARAPSATCAVARDTPSASTTASSHSSRRPRAPVSPAASPPPPGDGADHGRRLDARPPPGAASAPCAAASRSLCVTTTSVDAAAPRSARAAARAPARRSPGSRLPVGSSARSRRGRRITARATATRCCSPPDSSPGRCVEPRRQPDPLEQRRGACPDASARGSPRDQRRHHDVLERGEVGRAGDGTGRRSRPPGCGTPRARPRSARSTSTPSNSSRPPVGAVERAEEVQQRALADARLADDRDALARARRRGRARAAPRTTAGPST